MLGLVALQVRYGDVSDGSNCINTVGRLLGTGKSVHCRKGELS